MRVDVSDVLDAGALSTAAWVFAPPRERLHPSRVVLFAFPGGGYAKSYFHMTVPGRSGYSMARDLAERGLIVVACDHLGTGESSRPPAKTLTWQVMAAANDRTVREVLARLRRGDLIPRFDGVEPGPVVGLGHSFGAGLVTVQQHAWRTFDALVLLGRALGATQVPSPPARAGDEPIWKDLALQHDEVAASAETIDGYQRQHRRTAWQRYLFYWDDVPDDVIALDESLASTLPLDVARDLRGPNAVAAAAIDVPVMLGFGERDVSRDPRAEARSYAVATDVHIFVLARSAHCHDLAGSRAILWDRIARWIDLVTAPARL